MFNRQVLAMHLLFVVTCIELSSSRVQAESLAGSESPNGAPNLVPERERLEHDLPVVIVVNEQPSLYGSSAYLVDGVKFDVWEDVDEHTEFGLATWRGDQYDGVTTLIGERFEKTKFVAAHRFLPIPCYVRVTNLLNERSTIVRIIDRGPFDADGVIDLSEQAARELHFGVENSIPARIELVKTSDSYYLETDAVFGASERDELNQQLQDLPYVDVWVVPHQRNNWYRVKIGPFALIEDAARVKEWLKIVKKVTATLLEE